MPPRLLLTVVCVALGTSAAPLDLAVNIAFPAITHAFNIGIEGIRWVVVGYVLTYAGLLLLAGRLSDRFGHQRVFRLGIAASIGALAACALAQTFTGFILARMAQGLGAALLLGSGPAILTLAVADAQRARMVGIYTLAFALASASGPLLSGLLVSEWGWPAVFWFRLPVLAVALVLAMVLPPLHKPAGDSTQIDLAGACALLIGIVSVLLALGQGPRTGWLTPAVLALLAAALTALVIYWYRQRCHPDAALLDLAYFRAPSFFGTNVGHLLVSMAVFFVLLLVPFFLARRLPGELGLAGVVLAAEPAGLVLASAAVSRWLKGGVSDRLAVIALAGVATGLGCISLWSASVPVGIMVVTLLVCGGGYGFFHVAAMDRVMAALPATRRGVAGSLNMLTRTIGVATTASAGTLLFKTLGGEADAFQAAFSTTFLIAAGLVLAAGVLFAVSRPGMFSRPR
ncbi:MAG: MFS transporter [Gammaproteobacteria bacterium]|nr:MFS transporter [Gammaproteobacteria bacterium]